MMKALLLLLPLFAVVTSWGQGWRPGEMEIEVFLRHQNDRNILNRLNLNTESANPEGTTYRVYVTPVELEQISFNGLKYNITVDDLNLYYSRFWDNQLVPPGYYTYEQIISIADSLAINFPLICKKIVWGNSIGGRQLAALKISDHVDLDETEAEIMFDGGIHGDEVGSSQNVIMYARELCKGYGINPTYTSLINSREIWLYLMVNPDGRASMSRYNENFVDCNRDCGYMWNGEGNSTGAFSQPETKALRNCILDNQFVIYTNYHSGTEIVAYPWSYRGNMTRDHNHINNLASVYSSVSGYSNLQYGQGYTQMYPINGSTKDFVYGSLGNIGWSIEISNNKQPSASQISLYYNYNKPAMTEMINRCGWGIEGLVVDSLAGSPIRATLWISNYFPVNNDPLTGDYHKFVLPGTYTIRAEANGYKPKIITGVLVPQQGSVTANIALVPDQKWAGYRIISCQIPGNNFDDEGYTPGAIGRADSIAYALGKSGWIVIDMGDTIFDGFGNDFQIIQHGSPGKPFHVSGSNSMDGPFTVIGNGTGTTSFDLGATSIDRCRYIKILDMGTGPSSGPGVGFNLDAIEMITPPLIVNFTSSSDTSCIGTAVGFTDESAGNPTSWSWSFPGANPSFSTVQNPENIIYSAPGNYNVSLTVSNGVSSSTKTKINYITITEAPVVDLGNDTTICDWDHVILDAANPGATYLWSTGDTMQQITIDSTGAGYGSHDYSVVVTTEFNCIAMDTINITFDNCTGGSEMRLPETVTIYPNPASDGRFRIEISGGDYKYYQIISPAGLLVLTQAVTELPYSKELQLGQEHQGIYLLRMFGNARSETIKLIVR